MKLYFVHKWKDVFIFFSSWELFERTLINGHSLSSFFARGIFYARACSEISFYFKRQRNRSAFILSKKTNARSRTSRQRSLLRLRNHRTFFHSKTTYVSAVLPRGFLLSGPLCNRHSELNADKWGNRSERFVHEHGLFSTVVHPCRLSSSSAVIRFVTHCPSVLWQKVWSVSGDNCRQRLRTF